MKIINQSYTILDKINGSEILSKIEYCGKIAWRSHNTINVGTADSFVAMLIKRGHESVLEHVNITIVFITDRGVTHELVRHRLASYTQESTRYCNYAAKDGEITVIKPVFWDAENCLFAYDSWIVAMNAADKAYKHLIDIGASPQEARTVLPNSLATKIAVTANLREWRHILKLRCTRYSHPQIRALMIPLLMELSVSIPIVFDDILASVAGEVEASPDCNNK